MRYDRYVDFVEGRYPAACREFVIPADPGSESGAGAGIQRARLDSRFRGNDDFGVNIKKRWGHYTRACGVPCCG
jgi:hypothetical protein